MLLNVTLDLRDLLVKLLDVLLLARLFVLQLLLLVFFFLTKGLVFANVVLQVSLVVLELLGTVDERLMAALLLFFKLFDLLIHRVICQFSQEHLFLLIDELVDILRPLFSWELHSAPSNVHSFMDMILLFQVEVLFLRVVLAWRDISVLDSA